MRDDKLRPARAVFELDAKGGENRVVRKPGRERWFSLAVRADGRLILGGRDVVVLAPR